MRKKAVVVIFILVSFLLAGCSNKSVNEDDTVNDVVESSSRVILDSYDWENITVEKITPVTAFEVMGDELHIFPYNDGDDYVAVRIVYNSDNNFWGSVQNVYSGTDNFKEVGSTFLVTNETGVTYGMVEIDEEESYLVSSSLPSSYVESVMLQLCRLST